MHLLHLQLTGKGYSSKYTGPSSIVISLTASMFFRDKTLTLLSDTNDSALGTHEWLMYRAVLLCGLPSFNLGVSVSK